MKAPTYALFQGSLFGDPVPVDLRAARFVKAIHRYDDRDLAAALGISKWQVKRIRYAHCILRRHYYKGTEERMIRDLGPTLPDRELGLTIEGRTAEAIRKKRKRLGVQKRKLMRFAA
jgi:hypothetical protein